MREDGLARASETPLLCVSPPIMTHQSETALVRRDGPGVVWAHCGRARLPPLFLVLQARLPIRDDSDGD
jgi:hypothetical protein